MSCIMPIKVKNSNDQPVPCGKCTQCRKSRISGWSFRLMQEEKNTTFTHFLTLTYDPEKCYITANNFMSLNKRHLQLFFKRLRKAHGRTASNIKYYAAGEYGGKTNRPHYHVILFGCEPSKIESAWGLGNIHYGTVTGASVGYTLKYISKQSRIPQHKNDDRQKEFSLMSKGLGKSYLDPERGFVAWHKNDLENRMYLNVGNGKKAAMPRYYKDKLYTEKERKKIAAKSLVSAADKLIGRIEQFGLHRIIQGKNVNIEHEKQIITQPTKDSL